jgi:hypothetical protein
MLSALASSNRHHGIFRELQRMARAATQFSQEAAKVRQDGAEELDALEAESTDSPDEQDLVNELGSRNQEVLTHEAAHMAAAGSYIRGGASYTYQTGPDGRRYAIGGEVQVDMSPIPGNPRATILKMQAIKAAAMAPASPSPQDVSVASAASQIEAQARADLARGVEGGARRSPYESPISAKGLFVSASA